MAHLNPARLQVGGALVALAVLSGLGLASRAPRPIHGAPAWPTPGHPLGVDSMGRDFLAVLGAGTADFALPGLAAVLVLLGVAAGLGVRSLARPAVGVREPGPRGGLAGASPPRLLLVMVAMLFVTEPSAWLAAAVVTALYLPVALGELRERLADLVRREVLAGLVAHGLSTSRIVAAHLLGGHLREPLARHAATLFAQVAFTQVALSWIFGASAVTVGLGVSWGMEFRRLCTHIPTSGTVCPVGGACPEVVAAFQAACLLGVALLVFGGMLRMARPARSEA